MSLMVNLSATRLKKGDNLLIINRLEGEYAVCENSSGDIINISIHDISGGAKEGDVIVLKGELYIIDNTETMKRRNKNINLRNKLRGIQ